MIAFRELPNKSRLFRRDLRSTTGMGTALKGVGTLRTLLFLGDLPNLAMMSSAVSSPLLTFSTAVLNAKPSLGFESIKRLRSAIGSRLSYFFRSSSGTFRARASFARISSEGNRLPSTLDGENRDIPPRMVVGIRVSLQAVLDLTNPPSVLHQLNLEELLSEDWRKMNGEQKESRSQALGRIVAELGEGILAPSRIRMGKNLVIYPRSLKAGSRIEVLGEADLPN